VDAGHPRAAIGAPDIGRQKGDGCGEPKILCELRQSGGTGHVVKSIATSIGTRGSPPRDEGLTLNAESMLSEGVTPDVFGGGDA